MNKKATVLLLALVTGMSMAANPASAADMATAACSDVSAPLSGAWVASFWEPTDTITVTFKFIPMNTKCDQFVVNIQQATLPVKVLKAFPETKSHTEFVGTVCAPEGAKKADFTAVAYGSERTEDMEKLTFIAVMTGQVDLNVQGAQPNELNISATVAYYAAEQDKDCDGMPDTNDSLICICYTSKLKRVQQQMPCEPGQSFTACLEPCMDCETQGSGRAIFKLTDMDKKMFFLLKVKEVKDVTQARIYISETPGEIGLAAVTLFPIPPQTGPKLGEFTGVLSMGKFGESDFFGPLKGKTMQDLLMAIADYRAFVVVGTKKNTYAEICGAIVDP